MAFLITEDGTELFYKDCGSGKPFVLIHGWCINCDSWDYIITGLTDAGYRCITYDQRGCGRSGFSWNGYDYNTLSNDLATLINKLRLNDVTLIGHSLGCGIICTYLSKHGDQQISNAILIGTTTPYLARAKNNLTGTKEANLHAMRTDRPLYVRTLAEGFFNLTDEKENTSAPLVDWTVNLTLQASARAAEMMFITAFDSDCSSVLTQIRTPLLILHGTKDVSCPPGLTAVPTHELLVNSTLKMYEDFAHGMYINKATVICKDIITFLEGNKLYVQEQLRMEKSI